MKQLVCEICESTDLVKEHGVFVCQNCGAKYSTEELKKMLVKQKNQKQFPIQSSIEQGRYGESDRSQYQGKFGEKQEQANIPKWTCPECETINTAEVCALCGYENKSREKAEDICNAASAGRKRRLTIVTVLTAVCAVVLGIAIVLRMHTAPVQNTEIQFESNQNVLMEAPYMDGMTFGSSISRYRILTITFLNTLKDAPTDAWDVSLNGNKSVLAWAKQNGEDSFDLYIAGEGGVIAPQNCTGLFRDYCFLREINFNNSFDTSNVTSMNSMFSGCWYLSSVDVSGFDTSNVTSMHRMFYWCESLASVDVSGFDTSNVTEMSNMFCGCQSLSSVDVSGFDTSKTTMMNGMFHWCKSLSSVDVSGFDTSKVKNMYEMFCFCEKLTSLDIDHWDLSSVELYDMFMDSNAKINGRRWQEYFEK